MTSKRVLHTLSSCRFLLLAGIVACASISVTGQKSPVIDSEIRESLVRMRGSHRSTEQLAVLFRVGDTKIADLIEALRDPDENVSLGAQLAIRYLGNEEGMRAWRKAFEGDPKVPLTGPIPVPLSTLDYDFLRNQYLKDNMRTEALMDAYLYALALDGSTKAKQLLSDIIANANKHGFKLHESRYLLINKMQMGEEGDLAKQVLQRATFVDRTDRDVTTSKVIAFSAEKDKALVEIHINRGPLAQEWYHVVVRRVHQGWTIFSVTQVAVS